MKLCSWTAGCAQETSSDAELCAYHHKVSDGFLRESEEAEKVPIRRDLWRRSHTPGWRSFRSDDPEASDEPDARPNAPKSDPTDEGITMIHPNVRDVFFEPPNYDPNDIEAVLPDGTHVTASYQRAGKRLGFDRPLPIGTLVLLRGVRGWVVGAAGA